MLVISALSAIVPAAVTGCDQSGSSESGPDATTVTRTASTPDPADADPTNESPTTSDRPSLGAGTSSRTDAAGEGDTAPQIVFNKTVHDFGTIWDIEKQSYEFEFTNTGGETLVIEDIKTSCGCTAGEPDKYEYAPGESGTIDVSFKPKGHGPQTKNLTIRSNAANAPTQMLYIKSDIKQFVTVEPHILQMGTVRQGEPHTRSIMLTSVDPDFQIVELKPNTPVISAHVAGEAAGPSMPGESSGRPKEVVITLTEDAPWGQFFGAVNITTRGRLNPQSETIDHMVTVAVNANVYGELQPNPPFFRVAIVPPGDPFQATVTLRRSNGQPFKVTDARLLNPIPETMNLEVLPMAGDQQGYLLVITGETGDYMGRINGQVRVVTDIPGEDAIMVPVRGIVRDPDKPFP